MLASMLHSSRTWRRIAGKGLERRVRIAVRQRGSGRHFHVTYCDSQAQAAQPDPVIVPAAVPTTAATFQNVVQLATVLMCGFICAS